MADAVHQVLVDLAPDALSLRRLGRRSAAGGVADRGAALHDDVDELPGLVDASRDRAAVERLPVEAREVHVLVGRDDHAARALHVGGGNDVLGAALALGLHLDADAHLGGHLLEGLGGHEGVGDARRAGRDGEHVVARGVARCGASRPLPLLGEASVLLGVHERAELIGRPRGAQRGAEALVQEQRGEPAQDLEVRVGLALGRGYEEEQRRRLPVERLVVHPRGDRHGGEARRRDRRGLGVWDGIA